MLVDAAEEAIEVLVRVVAAAVPQRRLHHQGLLVSHAVLWWSGVERRWNSGGGAKDLPIMVNVFLWSNVFLFELVALPPYLILVGAY